MRPYRRWVIAFLAAALLLLAGCTVAPPRNPNNLCDIFQEKPDWYDAAKEAAARWGTPISVQMAIIEQESGFREEIKPPRQWILGFIPWTRPSSAYGYTQAIDSTWAWYEAESGNGSADRDDFDDAVDFVAWYVAQSHRVLGLSVSDTYSQYLAYHEGQGGFSRGSYANKEWLKNVAWRVDARAERYARQLGRCRAELERDDSWFF